MKAIKIVIACLFASLLLMGCTEAPQQGATNVRVHDGIRLLGRSGVQGVGTDIVRIVDNKTAPNPLELVGYPEYDVIFLNMGESAVRLHIRQIDVDTLIRPNERFEIRLDQSVEYELPGQVGRILLR